MFRKRALIVVFAMLVPVASVHGQAPADPDTASDFVTVCRDYGESELVFVGRAEAPVTFHISAEAEIDKARQNLISAEADMARLRASLDLYTRLQRYGEFELRIAKAQAELATRQAMYPRPYDLTLTPVHVEQAFRGVTAPRSMVWQPDPSRWPSTRMEPGELYLIRGQRSKGLIPPFPEISNLGDIDEYVETVHVTHVALAQRELQFLASTPSGATILGNLRMQSFAHEPAGAPLSGVRMLVSSGTHAVETISRPDGSFTLSGIQPGRLEIRPLLDNDLTVVNKSALKLEIREGGCKTAHLTAELNGRVRGRIISATGTSLDGVKLVLSGVDPSGRMEADFKLSHSRLPSSSVLPNEDGTFEFSGVSPGSYVLSAGLEKMTDGTRRYLITYFPGTNDRAGAHPIVIGRATQHDGFDFVVTTE